MTTAPPNPRTVVFVDGQNLFYAAKEAFGYTHPNYDVAALARRLCQSRGWTLSQVRFYTGVPDPTDDPFWHHFWTAKLAQMGRGGVHVFSRPLRYRHQTLRLPDGSTHVTLVGQEKGIDVRLALDVVRLASERQYDVALILSQDQDLTEAVEDVKLIGRQQNRWIWPSCVFPFSPTTRNRRGGSKTPSGSGLTAPRTTPASTNATTDQRRGQRDRDRLPQETYRGRLAPGGYQ